MGMKLMHFYTVYKTTHAFMQRMCIWLIEYVHSKASKKLTADLTILPDCDVTISAAGFVYLPY